METLRFNGFAMIHKALRAMLYDTAAHMQHVNFADVSSMLPVLAKAERVLELFDDHADHEDHHILANITDVNPGLARSFEQEHITDRKLGAALRDRIAEYKEAKTPTERIIAGNSVFYAFNEFIAFNLQHMNKEETALNETLWAKYTDGDIGAINQKIAGSVPPDKAVVNFTWMMRSCNDTEITTFLKAISGGAPEPLVNMVMNIAETELHADRWAGIRAALNEPIPS